MAALQRHLHRPDTTDPSSLEPGGQIDEWSTSMSRITSKVSVAVILTVTALSATGCTPVLSLIAVTT
jgi:hypothetical protein